MTAGQLALRTRPALEAQRLQWRDRKRWTNVWTMEQDRIFADAIAEGKTIKEAAEFVSMTEEQGKGRMKAYRREFGWQAS
jgi:hypothetical protein